MKEKNKYCCDEHIDIAFDDFLAEESTFPIMEKCEGKTCSYCNNKGQYVLLSPMEKID